MALFLPTNTAKSLFLLR